MADEIFYEKIVEMSDLKIKLQGEKSEDEFNKLVKMKLIWWELQETIKCEASPIDLYRFEFTSNSYNI